MTAARSWVAAVVGGGAGNGDAVVVLAGQHGAVADLLWDEVRVWFDPEVNGVLPDVRVENTSIVDWQTVLDLVRLAGWAYEYSVGGTIAPLPILAVDMLGQPDDELVELRVWPAEEMLVIFRLYAVEQVDFDVDLRELQGQDRLDLLCDFLRALGRAVGKAVVLTPEGFADFPVLGFVPAAGRVVMLAAVPIEIGDTQ